MTKPTYLSSVTSAAKTLQYRWDDWDLQGSFQPAEEQLLEQFGRLSQRARVAMTIAIAEWVVWRFEPLSNDPAPLQYLEAAWAGNIDHRYVRYIENDVEQWRGPVRGPLNTAMALVNDALFCADQSGNTAENPAWASNLAIRVLNDPTSFAIWRDAITPRLQSLYPVVVPDPDDLFGDQDTVGPYVPREAFDPATSFDPAQSDFLSRRFLAELQPTTNPYLRSADEMRARGFRGMPYTAQRELGTH